MVNFQYKLCTLYVVYILRGFRNYLLFCLDILPYSIQCFVFQVGTYIETPHIKFKTYKNFIKYLNTNNMVVLYAVQILRTKSRPSNSRVLNQLSIDLKRP